MTRSWVPVPGTTSGRLVVAALEMFGEHGFAPVSVGSIAERAGVTTGSLYHHFGSKADLYLLVRGDVERRVVDRFEGAASARPLSALPDVAPVLLAGFDYLVRSGLTRLLAESSPEPGEDRPDSDPVQQFLAEIEHVGAPLAALIAAAWRAALAHAGGGPDAADDARRALARLLGHA